MIELLLKVSIDLCGFNNLDEVIEDLGLHELIRNSNGIQIIDTDKVIENLTEISEGKGPYDTDNYKHAANCIENMKKLAVETLKLIKDE